MSETFSTKFNSESDETGIGFALLQKSKSHSVNNTSDTDTETITNESAPSESLELQLSKADDLWQQGNISEAIALYCQAIEQQPNATELYGHLLAVVRQQAELATAYTKLAEQLKQKGKTKEAALYYRQAIVLKAINDRAQKNYQKNQPNAIVVRPKSQIKVSVDSAFSFLPLSSRSSKPQILQISLDNDFKISARHHQNANDPKKRAKLYLQEALNYGDRQEWEEAARACQKALDLVPDMAAAYKILGNALQRMGKTAAAMDCYAKALEIQPDLAEVYAKIGSLYSQQEQWQPAIEYYQKAIVIRPNFAQAYRSLAEIWSLVGEVAKAESCRQQALSIESSQLNTANNENQFLALETQPSKVIADLPNTTNKNDFVIEYQKLAQELEKQQKWQEAALYYRKALELNLSNSANFATSETKLIEELPPQKQPNQLPPQNSHTQLFTTLTDDFRAKAETQDGSSPVNFAAGATSKERAELNDRVKSSPLEQPSLSQLDKAINRYLKRTEIQPDSAKLQTDLGNLYAKKREWKIALAAYQQAIKINDRYAPAYLNLAKILAKLGKKRESVSYMYRALSLNPEILSAKDYFYLGKSFIEQDRLRKGLSYCLKAVRLDPNYLEVYSHLVAVVSQKGQQQKAINYLHQAIKRNPKDAQAYYLLGQTLAAQTNWDEAVKAYSQVLQIQPKFPLASEKLNHALAEKLKQQKQKINQINSN